MAMMQNWSLMIGALAVGCASIKVDVGSGIEAHSGQPDTQAVMSAKAPDQERPPHAAVCEVVSGVAEAAPTSWTGPCTRRIAQPSAKHFSIAGINNSQLIPGILNISVSILGPGRADVRGLTTEGINSRWGSAVQDVKDPFCWIGTDFRICARPAQ